LPKRNTAAIAFFLIDQWPRAELSFFTEQTMLPNAT